ncbi:hypothetical protein [Cupriavidus sp. AcVe19-6a]|uniref:hypothetical protein n=1 Tax=Cupriavidus sp. AcVe19-6a TaxID=2821358 RepID=UPI001AE31A05|nr:hypothetical protein [Cupriavidus sp. AcVe19-6a]MBP0639450.1 hypothetical protein [Cupriavidus sp. AcVe19-6a]
MKFGKFESVEDFLSAYAAAQRAAIRAQITGISLEAARARLRRRKERDVVEVQAIIAEYLGIETSGASHQHLTIQVEQVTDTDPDVQEDLDRVVSQQEIVFVSVRVGDRQGIDEPLTGLETGTALNIRGEWIPKERAYAHGGERMSVLHFTHDPIGFICTPESCYS